MTPKPKPELNNHGGVHSLEYVALQGGMDRAVDNLEDKLLAQERLFDEKIKGLVAADASLKEATLLAHQGIQEHQKASNNLQALLREQEQENAKRLDKYVPFAEYQIYNRKLESDIRALELSRAEVAGKASSTELTIVSERANRAFTISIIMAIIAISSFIFTIARFFIK